MDPIQSECGKILFADDGSEHAQAALTLLAGLPLPSDCQVTVLRAFGSQQAGELVRLEEALAATCTRLRSKGLQANSELLLGSPAQVVTEYAEAHPFDLIVLGAKGLRATLGILLGGVAQQVVEYSTCPVLVVRTPYTAIRRVLLTTDGSPSSREALEFLGRFPLPAGVDMRVMHVLPPPPIPVVPVALSGATLSTAPLDLSEDLAEARASEEEVGRALLEGAVSILAQEGIAAMPVLLRGDAASEILAYIQEQGIDLTVTGSRGLSRVQSWLMGSVSRKLVHYSGCSVLVVRSPRPAGSRSG